MHRIFIFITLLFCGMATAQSITVSGTVFDAKSNELLPGATIVVEGTNSGTTSDFDGNFSITANAGDLITFSYVGYETYVQSFSATTNLQVFLESDNDLDEVVVIGYGNVTKKEVTGAVTVIGSQSINKLNPTRIEQALQGQVSGVNITSASGSPGSGLNIRIRGISTNGDNRPLILLDGNVIEDLAVLNPKDIESINVIKDATAGIYGVRGANGVILITSKSGSKNTGLSLQLDTYFGIQYSSKSMDLLNTTEYAYYTNQISKGKIKDNTLVYNTDWQKQVFDFAPISDTNLSVSGGSDKATYSASISYLYQDGIVGLSKSNFSRLTSRIKYQRDLTENLKLNFSKIYTHSVKNNLPENGIGAVLYNAINMGPTITVYNPSDYDEVNNPNSYSLIKLIRAAEIINPIAQINNADDVTVVDKYSATLGLDYNLSDKIQLTSSFQMNHANVLDDDFRAVINYGPGKTSNRIKAETVDHGATFDDYTWDNFLTYQNNFNDTSNLKLLLGSSIFQTTGKFYGYSFEEGDEETTPRFTADAISKGSDVFDSRLASLFSRLQLNIDNRYLLSAVVRRDGSSKFSPENKFGIFPSGSIGWNISEEKFFSSSLIQNLKFRASYGIIGNDRISDFGFVARLNGEAVYSNNNETSEEDLLRGVAIGKLSNPEIRWEKQKTANAGLDILMLNNKLRMSFDAYQRETEDLLIDAQVSGLLGVSAPGSGSPFVNAGTVRNQGLEAAISYADDISDNFAFNISTNISTIDNEVLFVESENGFQQGGGWGVGIGVIPSRMEAGYPLGYFYGFKTNGIFQTQAEIDDLNALAFNEKGVPVEYVKGAKVGDLKFVDLNGDGRITEEGDRTYIGDPIPDFTMGLSLGFRYKDYDFSASTYASVGNDMVRDYERQVTGANRSDYVLSGWTESNPSNTTPRASGGGSINNKYFSDYFVEDASYLRIQNIQIGYTANENILDFLKLDSLRAYVSINNLFTFTNYNGFDPSASSDRPIGAGIDKGFYPVPRTFMFGLNVKL